MLERELTPRNVDSSRGQAGWKSCSVFRWDQGKTKQSLLPTLRSYQQCIIHFTGAVNRLICIIFRRNLHLVCFRPRKENPQIFNGSDEIHNFLLRSSVATSNFPLSKNVFIYLFACLGERYGQSEEPFVWQRKKNGLESKCYSFHPAKILEGLDGASIADFGIALSRVYFSIFLDSSTCDVFHRSKLTAH